MTSCVQGHQFELQLPRWAGQATCCGGYLCACGKLYIYRGQVGGHTVRTPGRPHAFISSAPSKSHEHSQLSISHACSLAVPDAIKQSINHYTISPALTPKPSTPHHHHYATLNSGISPISCFSSLPTLYATLHLSLIASTFFVLSPECHTLIDCVTPRLCLGARLLPDCGFSSSS